jgi:hypothetical protein
MFSLPQVLLQPQDQFFGRLFPFSLNNQNHPVHLIPLKVLYKGKFM